jgi:hypothetical protein
LTGGARVGSPRALLFVYLSEVLSSGFRKESTFAFSAASFSFMAANSPDVRGSLGVANRHLVAPRGTEVTGDPLLRSAAARELKKTPRCCGTSYLLLTRALGSSK